MADPVESIVNGEKVIVRQNGVIYLVDLSVKSVSRLTISQLENLTSRGYWEAEVPPRVLSKAQKLINL